MSELLVRFLRLPPEPPAPFGEEQSLLVFRAAPNFLKYRIVMWALGSGIAVIALAGGALIAMVAAIAEGESEGVPFILLGGIAVMLFAAICLLASFLMLRLDYQMRWYKVTDRSLRIREGVWHVREMTMTFANIQNMEITQGPVQRLLGIADLKVQTAGGGGSVVTTEGKQHQVFNMHVGYFRGVDNAEEIMALMRERLKKYRSSGLGDRDDAVDHHSVGTGAPPAVDAGLLAAARDLLEEARGFRSAAEATARRLSS